MTAPVTLRASEQSLPAAHAGRSNVATRKTLPVPVTLRALRLRRGWSIRELAGRACLPPATVSRLERGIMVPTAEQTMLLSNAIGHMLRPAFVLCAEEQA